MKDDLNGDSENAPQAGGDGEQGISKNQHLTNTLAAPNIQLKNDGRSGKAIGRVRHHNDGAKVLSLVTGSKEDSQNSDFFAPQRPYEINNTQHSGLDAVRRQEARAAQFLPQEQKIYDRLHELIESTPGGIRDDPDWITSRIRMGRRKGEFEDQVWPILSRYFSYSRYFNL